MKKDITEKVAKKTTRREMLKYSGAVLLGNALYHGLPKRTAHASPTKQHLVFTHGHSMQIEHPDRIENVWRAGFYIRVDGKPGTDNWFHFAIPTIAILNSSVQRVYSVELRFMTGSPDAIVGHVHVYDGEKRIAAHNDVNLTGEKRDRSFDVPNTPRVAWGLGISIGVRFGNRNMSHRMEFISAGASLG